MTAMIAQTRALGPVVADRVEAMGQPQQAGALTVVPLFGPQVQGFAAPRTSLKLSRVEGYGNMELENRPDGGIAIVPLHIGYIQKGAQNHAMCRSAFLAPGQKVMFRDACCVQASQGGYLEERDQWFFILPLWLREKALELRGQPGYSKLWEHISSFNQRFGRQAHGHVEEVIGNDRAQLNRYASRLELSAGQTGALFFLRDTLVGVEIAPDEAAFAELWPALVCFCYGTEAHLDDLHGVPAATAPALAGDSLEALRHSLAARRSARQGRLVDALASLGQQGFELTEEERLLDLRLSTAAGRDMVGQLVHQGDRLVSASLFARTAVVEQARAA